MRISADLCRGFALVYVLSAAAMGRGAEPLPAGQSLWIRLTAPVTTYTAKAGDTVHAVLTQDVVHGSEIMLRMGTPIEGIVRSRRKVGWGIRHETAALDIEFNRAIAVSGESVTLNARVEEVENAREAVHNGVIQGIRSTDTFQGRINSRLIHLPTWNPYSDPVLIGYKVAFPIFPEPEIYYPAGTDLRLRTTAEISVPESTVNASSDASLTTKTESDELDQFIGQLPWRVTTQKDVNADVLNIVFLGSEDEVRSAFQMAGWHNADPFSKGTVFKNLYALLNNSGYPRQPMMTFLLNGKPQDMNWQKSLNSYSRRDHLRIWQWAKTADGESVWISSSTHDTSAGLAVKYRGFVHHIAPDIDNERSTVIRDLNYAGCVKSVSYVARPEVPNTTRNATGDNMRTDGSIAVIALQSCQPTTPQGEPNAKRINFKAGNHAFRFIRRQILTFKNDMLRANIIYVLYDGGRMAVTAMRHQTPAGMPLQKADMTLSAEAKLP